ncbi:ribonuclease J [Patescibacteria group bacterium]
MNPQKKAAQAVKSNNVKTNKPSKSTGNLRIIPLGGNDGVGERNMMLIELNEDILIIDMGVYWPDEDMPGIDYIIPNIEYLRGKEKNIKAVVITHGHLDHTGAIQHIMPEIGNPVMYTHELTKGLIEERMKEYPDTPKLNIKTVKPRDRVKAGKFEIEFFKVDHNIMGAMGIAVRTPAGTVVHTGDWKFDHNPIEEEPSDLGHLAEIGSKGVLALLSDSTDSFHEGYQKSETEIMNELDKIFFEAEDHRIIAATFSSSLSRVQAIINLCEKHDRKLVIEGRSMKTNVDVAQRLKYIKIKPGIVIEAKDARRLPDHKVMILGTGAQGEEMAMLQRIVNREHHFFQLKEGDRVIFTSSVIPGNERTIQNLQDSIVKQGATIIHYKMLDIHAGGHAKREEQKIMIRLMRPEYFVPIEANHFMLQEHARIAQALGISEKKTFVLENGQVLEIDHAKKARIIPERVSAARVMVDGLGVGDVSNVVLRDRVDLSQDGMFVIIVTLGAKGKLIGNPDIISRGFIYMKDNKDIIENTRQKVKEMINQQSKDTKINQTYIKTKIRNDVGQFLYSKTKRRPMILPVIIEV